MNPYEVGLDIGDEFFAFEEYRCAIEEDGKGELWYRGYVVQSVALSSLIPSANPNGPVVQPRPEPSVLIGIFPALCVYIRQEASTDDGTLTAAYEAAVRRAHDMENERSSGRGFMAGHGGGASFGGEMDAVKEEDEDEAMSDSQRTPRNAGIGSRLSALPGDSLDAVLTINKDKASPSGPNGTAPAEGSLSRSNSKRKSLTLAIAANAVAGPSRTPRPKSLIAERRKTIDGEDEEKEQPPLPRLTAGDSTLAGQQWPLVDEIACAIRDWYQRLPTYLVNRNYRLFTTVIQHIDALWLGRRQLLSQTLSGDELSRVRRECVSRLVKCNVAQGLEVIVRSLEDGSVMVMDKERAYSGATWISGISAYVQQMQVRSWSHNVVSRH